MNAYTEIKAPPKSAMATFAKREHKAVVRTLGYVLTLGNREAWFALVPILMARLTTEERAALAFASLKALERDDAISTAEAAIDKGAGPPMPPLFSFMDEAAFWADMAHPEELEAYCLASFNRITPKRKAAFLGHVRKEAVS